VHDNNNPNVPSLGVAGAAPVGTGITIYGGRHDVITNNRIVNNGAWGIIFVPFPDTEQPPPEAHCNGGADLSTRDSPLCYYDNWGSEVANNTFANNGSFGNPSNGDIAEASQSGGPGGPSYNPDSNCFHDNVDTGGPLTSAPANIDSYSQCGQTYTPSTDPSFTGQIVCASSLLIDCPASPAANYKKPTDIQLKMPPAQQAMPNPLRGRTRKSLVQRAGDEGARVRPRADASGFCPARATPAAPAVHRARLRGAQCPRRDPPGGRSVRPSTGVPAAAFGFVPRADRGQQARRVIQLHPHLPRLLSERVACDVSRSRT